MTITINPTEVMAEVTNDLTKMFEEQKNMDTEYTYGRMTTAEFAANRKTHSQANITGWFGWNNRYANILAARILRNAGHIINQPVYMLDLSETQIAEINKAIDTAVAMFLDVVLAS